MRKINDQSISSSSSKFDILARKYQTFGAIKNIRFPYYTVKPVNKGHPRERQHMTFIDKWSFFGGYFVLFYQGKVIEVWTLFTGWSLFGGGL